MSLERMLCLAFAVSLVACSPDSEKENHGLKDALDGSEFWYMNLEDRLTLTEEIFRVINARYSPLGIKSARLGLDSEVLGQEALSEELQYPDPPAADMPELEAQINIDFIDRTKRRIAKFQDTHLPCEI